MTCLTSESIGVLKSIFFALGSNDHPVANQVADPFQECVFECSGLTGMNWTVIYTAPVLSFRFANR